MSRSILIKIEKEAHIESLFFWRCNMQNIIVLFIFFNTIFAWLSPNHVFPWKNSHGEFSIFISVLLILFYVIIKYKKLEVQKHNLFFLCLAIVPLLQFFIGKIYFFGDAFIASMYIFAFLIALVLGNTLGKKVIIRQNIFLIFSCIVFLSGLVSFFLQLCQWLSFELNTIYIIDMPPTGRPFANFGQPNTLATFLTFSIFTLLYLYERQKIGSAVCILATSIFLFGIVLTQSRTPWVFSLAFLIWWFWKSKAAHLRIKTQGILIGYGVYILLLCITPFISDFLMLSFRAVEERADSGLQRLDLWQQMWIAVQNSPWSGYGWQQVSVAQVDTVLLFPTPFQGWTEHSHNILLDILVWNGLPLGILIIILIIWWLYQFVALVNTPENFLFLSLIGAVLVHSMFEYPLEYAFFLLPIGFLFGLIQMSEQSISTKIFIPKYMSISILVLSCIVYGWVFREYRIIEQDTQAARYEALNIGTRYSQQQAPDVVILTQLQAKIALMRTQPRPNMTNEEIISVKKTVYRYATKAALIRYSQVLALNGYKTEALKHLDIIEKMYQDKINYNALLNVQDSLAFKWSQAENE